VEWEKDGRLAKGFTHKEVSQTMPSMYGVVSFLWQVIVDLELVLETHYLDRKDVKGK